MNHNDHVALLRAGVEGPGVWGDFGSGTGAFTLALADLLGPEGQIFSIDRDARSLRDQESALRIGFPIVPVVTIVGDYTRSLPVGLPPLDGIVIANALHFQHDRAKPAVLQLLRGYLKPTGRLIVVEYNTDHGNRWVPHPFSYSTWRLLAHDAGFVSTRLITTRPSRFLGEIFSAMSTVTR